MAQLQPAVAAILRVLKITEPAVQVAHDELPPGPYEAQALRFIAEDPGCMAGAEAAYLWVSPDNGYQHHRPARPARVP